MNFMAKCNSAIWYEFSHRVSVDFWTMGYTKHTYRTYSCAYNINK